MNIKGFHKLATGKSPGESKFSIDAVMQINIKRITQTGYREISKKKQI